ncbi:hypothetical protein FOZ60_010233 [Perkinsus olseni]|uniref:Uncharacterized protein n=1 Tax=Perkinsus olseni TaxID=32597 RepID=A0A7J6NFS2_PEROL|nr:hypothetical protein FOZ60_010233 [Perkinsus olseni]
MDPALKANDGGGGPSSSSVSALLPMWALVEGVADTSLRELQQALEAEDPTTVWTAVRRLRERAIALHVACGYFLGAHRGARALAEGRRRQLDFDNKAHLNERIGEEMVPLRLWTRGQARDQQWNVRDAATVLMGGDRNFLPELTADLVGSIGKPYVVSSSLAMNSEARGQAQEYLHHQLSLYNVQAGLPSEALFSVDPHTDTILLASRTGGFSVRAIYDLSSWTILDVRVHRKRRTACRIVLQAVMDQLVREKSDENGLRVMYTCVARMAAQLQLRSLHQQARDLMSASPEGPIWAVNKVGDESADKNMENFVKRMEVKLCPAAVVTTSQQSGKWSPMVVWSAGDSGVKARLLGDWLCPEQIEVLPEDYLPASDLPRCVDLAFGLIQQQTLMSLKASLKGDNVTSMKQSNDGDDTSWSLIVRRPSGHLCAVVSLDKTGRIVVESPLLPSEDPIIVTSLSHALALLDRQLPFLAVVESCDAKAAAHGWHRVAWPYGFVSPPDDELLATEAADVYQSTQQVRDTRDFSAAYAVADVPGIFLTMAFTFPPLNDDPPSVGFIGMTVNPRLINVGSAADHDVFAAATQTIYSAGRYHKGYARPLRILASVGSTLRRLLPPDEFSLELSWPPVKRPDNGDGEGNVYGHMFVWRRNDKVIGNQPLVEQESSPDVEDSCEDESMSSGGSQEDGDQQEDQPEPPNLACVAEPTVHVFISDDEEVVKGGVGLIFKCWFDAQPDWLPGCCGPQVPWRIRLSLIPGTLVVMQDASSPDAEPPLWPSKNSADSLTNTHVIAAPQTPAPTTAAFLADDWESPPPGDDTPVTNQVVRMLSGARAVLRSYSAAAAGGLVATGVVIEYGTLGALGRDLHQLVRMAEWIYQARMVARYHEGMQLVSADLEAVRLSLSTCGREDDVFEVFLSDAGRSSRPALDCCSEGLVVNLKWIQPSLTDCVVPQLELFANLQMVAATAGDLAGPLTRLAAYIELCRATQYGLGAVASKAEAVGTGVRPPGLADGLPMPLWELWPRNQMALDMVYGRTYLFEFTAMTGGYLAVRTNNRYKQPLVPLPAPSRFFRMVTATKAGVSGDHFLPLRDTEFRIRFQPGKLYSGILEPLGVYCWYCHIITTITNGVLPTDCPREDRMSSESAPDSEPWRVLSWNTFDGNVRCSVILYADEKNRTFQLKLSVDKVPGRGETEILNRYLVASSVLVDEFTDLCRTPTVIAAPSFILKLLRPGVPWVAVCEVAALVRKERRDRETLRRIDLTKSASCQWQIDWQDLSTPRPPNAANSFVMLLNLTVRLNMPNQSHILRSAKLTFTVSYNNIANGWHGWDVVHVSSLHDKRAAHLSEIVSDIQRPPYRLEAHLDNIWSQLVSWMFVRGGSPSPQQHPLPQHH